LLGSSLGWWSEMTKWEKLEEFLYDLDLKGYDLFNHAAVAANFRCSGDEASDLIQAYLDHQNSKRPQCLYTIHRTPATRTASATWKVGVRSNDARETGKQLTSDVVTRVRRAVEPTLARIGEKNKRALPAANAVIKGIEAGVEIMVSLLGEDD